MNLFIQFIGRYEPEIIEFIKKTIYLLLFIIKAMYLLQTTLIRFIFYKFLFFVHYILLQNRNSVANTHRRFPST